MTTLSLAALGLLSFAPATPASAAVPATPATAIETASLPADDLWGRRLTRHLAVELASSSAETRAQTMSTVVSVARAYPDRVDLRPLAPALLSIYREDPDERHRFLAVVALHATADESAMQALRSEVVREPAPRVQRVLLAVLVDYYGPGTFEGDLEAAAVAEALLARRAAAVL